MAIVAQTSKFGKIRSDSSGLGGRYSVLFPNLLAVLDQLQDGRRRSEARVPVLLHSDA